MAFPFTLDPLARIAPAPFAYKRSIPIPLLKVFLGLPLVHAYQPYHEMREAFVQAARTGRNRRDLYLDGVSLAAMGGEPYAVWS